MKGFKFKDKKSNTNYNKHNHHALVHDITIIGLLSAFNIASRVFFQFAPNIKPVTTIIIITAMVLGIRYSIYVNIVTVLISGIMLGFGTFIPFQILAWAIIGGIAGILHKDKRYKHIPIGFMAAFSAIGGFVFGFFVSLDKFFIAGPYAFWVYYLNGLPFDCLHAIGNFAFYLVCAPFLIRILERELKKNINQY